MRRLLPLLTIAVAVGLFATTPAKAALDSEAELVNLINKERVVRGLPPLIVHRDLIDDARLQAERMVALGTVFHSADLGSVTSGWEGLGEVVGRGSSASEVLQTLMASPTHRAIILGDFQFIGVGTAGWLYVVGIFMRGGHTATTYSGAFWDDELTIHEADINRLALAGITQGCGNGQYCPWQTVTRAQMAAFLVRSIGLPTTPNNYFWDDTGSMFEPDINALAAPGIAQGCGNGGYCPGQAVTRGEMAALLVRALGLPATPNNYFWDDSGSMFEPDINALAAAGIAQGCGNGQYCPGQAVTRAEMAAFLARGFGL
jgi:hypothetical protein